MTSDDAGDVARADRLLEMVRTMADDMADPGRLLLLRQHSKILIQIANEG